MRRLSLTITVVLAVFGLSAASSNAAVLYTSVSSTYAESFDSLAATGTALTWANDTTLPGWYAYKSNAAAGGGAIRDAGPWSALTQYATSDGSLSTGFYSFGGSATYPSVNPDSDRALGSVPGGSPWGDIVQALVLQNKTGQTLTQFTLSYAGEQWKAGAGGGTRWQDFDYKVSATFNPDTDLPGNVVAGYNLTGVDTVNPFLDFSGGGGSAVYDGNTASHRQLKSETVAGINWAPDDYLILRWWHDNAAGSDHGLAVDDLSFVATPEPATIALMVAGGLLAMRPRRR